MKRIVITLSATLAIFVTPVLASSTQATQATNAAMREKAEHLCNDALEHDRFGNYSTMDECIDDTVTRLARADRAATVRPRAVVNNTPH